jgi:hypothetical protein
MNLYCCLITESYFYNINIELYLIFVSYMTSELGPKDIDFFGLYDCFPICFIRAIEAVKVSVTTRCLFIWHLLNFLYISFLSIS